MNCQDFLVEIDKYIENNDFSKSSHLSSCLSCQSLIGELAQVRSVFSTLPKHIPSDKVSYFILQEAAKQGVVKSGLATLLKRQIKAVLSLSWNWAPSMVVVMLVVGVVSLMMPSLQNSDSGALVAQKNFSSLSYVVPTQVPHFEVPSFENRQSGLIQPVSVALEGTSVLESDDQAADLLLMHGRRLKSMGHVEQALKDFETIFRLYPDYTYMDDVLFYRAQCFAVLGQTDNALESLNLLLKKSPSKESVVLPMMEQIKEAQK